jgi:hypothetical protein
MKDKIKGERKGIQRRETGWDIKYCAGYTVQYTKIIAVFMTTPKLFQNRLWLTVCIILL